MTKPREQQVSLSDTPYYHCMVRCVRRAFLCGEDRETGQNFDHRKQWLVSRLRFLSSVYAIDICAYAIMSNHYHVVLYVDQERVIAWSDEDVAMRWKQLYKGSLLVDKWLIKKDKMSKAERKTVAAIIAVWRERLSSISWFMRGVNEQIARMANDEDGCKGRFWEGRFKSQALLDEAALLSCMAYVDLNPVRAAIADDLIGSDFTSIQQRLMDHSYEAKTNESAKAQLKRIKNQQADRIDALSLEDLPSAALKPFGASCFSGLNAAIPFSFADYLALVDTTGRIIRQDKRGAIAESSQKLVERVGLNPDDWLQHVQQFGRRFAHQAGLPETLYGQAKRCGSAWFKGVA